MGDGRGNPGWPIPEGVVDRLLDHGFDRALAGLSGPGRRRSSLMYFETLLASGWLAGDAHVDRRRRLEAAVRTLAEDRTLSPREGRRVARLLSLMQGA